MMTDKQRESRRESTRRWREKNPEKMREIRRLWREKNRGNAAFYDFVYRQRNPEKCKASRAAWDAANPEKIKEFNRRKQPMTDARKLMYRRRARRRWIAECKDRAALDARIIANVSEIVPNSLPRDVRSDVIASMIAAVYSGELRIRPSKDDAKAHMTAHFRIFTKFGPESLDAPRFHDGSGSYHDTISKGLWQ